MPWWSWIVIWIALVALSLLFIGVLGLRLFRKFMATAKELGEAGERFSNFPSGPGTSRSDDVHVGRVGSNGDDAGDGPGQHAVPGSAVFASPHRVRHDYHASKLARQEARRLRRIQRKTDRGQPQALRDIEFS